MHNDQDQSRSERDLAAGPAESDRAYEPLDDLQQRSPIRRRLQALRAIGFAPKELTKILGVSDTTLRNWERDDVVPRDPATRVLDTLRLAVLGLHDADIHGEEAYTWLTSADTSGWLDGARPVDVIAESSTFVLAAVEDEVLHVLADKPARQRTYHLPLQPARPVRARRGDSHRADAGGKPKRATTTKRRAAKRRVAPKDCD